MRGFLLRSPPHRFHSSGMLGARRRIAEYWANSLQEHGKHNVKCLVLRLQRHVPCQSTILIEKEESRDKEEVLGRRIKSNSFAYTPSGDHE